MATGTASYLQTDRHRSNAPPLPPRGRPRARSLSPDDAPPPYTEIDQAQHPLLSLTSRDPRSSSTQSLVPEERSQNDTRRKLLLIYIHGFMGAENSFRSFPAHVHNLLAITLADTHVVHSKIYPRYQSRRHIQYASEDFSRWLSPHEAPNTDVVLLGHSMGGLLSAEVVLLQPRFPETGKALRHRILGTINFDVPFLGMHPGVIASGLGSIFNPAPPPTDQPASSSSHPVGAPWSAESASSSNMSLSSPTSAVSDPFGSSEPTDPNFNPNFENDIRKPMRKGWGNALHFMMKHKNNLTKATRQLVTSHLEFGGAMADFNGLKARYTRIRALEEEDEMKRRRAVPSISHQKSDAPARVRFVNYYTASTGRPKKSKEPSTRPAGDAANDDDGNSRSTEAEIQNLSLSTTQSRSSSRSPRISVEEYRDGEVVQKQVEDVDSPLETLEADDPRMDPIDSSEVLENSADAQTVGSDLPADSAYLPDIPPVPEEPPSLNLPPDIDSQTRKYAEQGHALATKQYKAAIKARGKVIKERENIQAKHAKQLRKQQEAKAKQKRREEEKRLKQEDAGNKTKMEINEQEQPQPDDHELLITASGIEAQKPAIPEQENPTAKLASPSELTQLPHMPSSQTIPNPENNNPPPSPPPSIAPSTHPSSASPSPSQLSLHTIPSLDSSLLSPTQSSHVPDKDPRPSKPPRDRKFCILPPETKNVDGSSQRDPSWVRVYMPGVDEVGAHCGLFFMGEAYERLVGDVAGRVEGWVMEAEGERVAREMGG
ncbi:MAG: hypothetical protein M1820_010066 [Bogoriella megaspora]|nr:MAG: hypothetical protein M1820_010066 [Bogoriella megaspora]